MFINEQMGQADVLVNITIKKSSDDTIVIDNQAMSSLGHGLYKYNFSSRLKNEQYYYFCINSTNKKVVTGVIQKDLIVENVGLTQEEHNKLMGLVNTSLGTLERKVKILLALLPTLEGLRK